MKVPRTFLFVIASVALASPAAASQCYQSDDNPDWTVTVNDPGVEPEMVWNQGGEIVEMATVGAGTGIPRRYAVVLNRDDDGHYPYLFVDGVLVLDMGIYRPGCRSK